MKVCAFQPWYPYQAQETDAYVQDLKKMLNECDESLDLIVLPECCNAPTRYKDKEEFYSYIRKHTQLVLDMAQATAKRCHAIVAVNIYDGPVHKLRNATVVIDRDGEKRYTYYKQHLPEGETAGGRVDDSYTFEYRPLSVAEIEGVRYGFLTCYDAYYNEFIAEMARHNLDIILYPSYQRGETDHILQMEAKNIAFNCNAFVIRSSVSMGKDSGCGANTMVVSPDGSIMSCIGQDVGRLICEIDPKTKHSHCNGYGYQDVPTQSFVERRRRPWAYRAAGPFTVPGDKDTTYPRVCSHRGFNKFAPENSMAAFGLAVALGATEIELDVWPTKDGRLVVCHDKSVDRVSNGSGKICDLTWEEIQKLDIGEKHDPVLTGLRIPLLDEVLRKFSNQVIMNIHIKSPSADAEEYDHDTFRRLVDLIYQYDCQNHVYIAGEEDVLRTAAELAPELPRCALDRHKDFQLVKLAKRYGCAKVQLCKHRGEYYFNHEMVAEAAAAGIGCTVFYSVDPEETRWMLEMGIDTILTNDYLRISAVVEDFRKSIAEDSRYRRHHVEV